VHASASNQRGAKFPNNFGHKNNEQAHLLVPMEEDMSEIDTPNDPSFFTRIITNDAAKKGLATAIAGVLIAAVTELVWPSK
jgi:hypothetical protein